MKCFIAMCIAWIVFGHADVQQKKERTETIDAGTMRQWSAPYRGWTYHREAVIPSDYRIPGAEGFYNYDVPCVYQTPDNPDVWYMSFIGFNDHGYNSFVAESRDLFQMDGGKIYDNSAQYGGGVLILGAGARFTMNGGEMYDNHSTAADEGGGAVYIWQNGGVEIHSGAIIYGENGDGGNKAGNTATNATYGHAVTAFFTNAAHGKYRSTTIQNEELSITLSSGSETESSGSWSSW
ncbi:MAG: hypothetical protein LBT49_02850 [Prevotellaceae bacterium]|jgi:hypothetical protein|nr:hypothetical protein [Prevotellaceae bacterium]